MAPFVGSEHASYLDELIKKRIAEVPVVGKLLIVLIGDNQASLKYINVKMKLCERLGIPVKFVQIDKNLPDEQIFSQVAKLFEDPKNSGGIVQLPLPRESLNKIFETIPCEKDIDLISSKNVERFANGGFNELTPVLRATMYFLLYSKFNKFTGVAIKESLPLLKEKLAGSEGYIIGKGFLVGLPVSQFLKRLNIPIRINQKYQTGEKIYSNFAILGVGKPNLVNGEDICKNCDVLDFGTTVIDGKVVGDLNKTSKSDHLGLVSFSPGGIGPIVVRFLLMNHLKI